MNNQAKDTVLAHQQHNCAPHLPSSSQLASIQDQQYSQPQSTTLTSLQLLGMANQAQNVTCPSQLLETVNPIVVPIGPSAKGTKSWQMQFYKPAVQDILECAKQFSHCNATSVNAFPLHSQFNSLTVEYMEEAISKRQSHGLPVSDGEFISIPHFTH